MRLENVIKQHKKILLISEGGAGKTTSLISVYKYYIDNPEYKIVPIYIPLYQYKKEGWITAYVLQRYVDRVDKNETELFRMLNSKKSFYKYLFLFDGVNEISVEKDSLYDEIEQISQLENVISIVTMRNSMNVFDSFKKYRLSGVSYDLLENIIRTGANHHLVELLCKPFYYSKYMSLMGTEMNVMTAGELLKCFFEVLINKNKETCYKLYQSTRLIIDSFLPKVCYDMVMYGQLSISGKWCDEKCNEWIEDKVISCYKKYIKDDYLTILLDLNIINFTYQNKEIEVHIHEIYRDYFAAKYSFENGKNGYYETNSVEMAEFIYDLTGEKIGIIPTSNKFWGNWAFCECKGVEKIFVPWNFIAMECIVGNDEHTLNKFIDLSTITVDVENEIYSSENGVLFNKDKTELMKYPCAKKGSVYVIPNVITKIRTKGFEESKNLQYVELNDGIVAIEDFAFALCINLKCLIMPDSIQKIGRGCFLRCVGIREVKLSNRIETIETLAFFGCSNIKSVYIPESVTRIENGAFENCNKLVNVYISKNVKYIAPDAFAWSNSVVLNCYVGSYAEEYAKEKGLRYKLL